MHFVNGDELWEQEGKKKNVEIMGGNRWNYFAVQEISFSKNSNARLQSA